ncbi:hypothetical protein KIH39_15910 [Telmatocola sphagniphila]|uniref:Uncharacterized protein n=1 Tax=Telmatocola sphagniphila TaxID=1123043 RepID=A0A8E6ETS3_9BACT|nr:hypothetical protein [Telmatocola sphagniphila]QVL30337.1 hypothetical protein KIH39_15910 [Telmatocola sphagniphila]
MGFKLTSNSEGRSQIELTDDSPYIIPLTIAPSSIEDILTKGKWLVVSFSVWSIQDLESANIASNIMKQYGQHLRLGLRPFDYPDENLTWLPLTKAAMNESVDIEVVESNKLRRITISGRADKSPIWATILNGQFISISFGHLSEMDIHHLIKDLLNLSW